MLGMKHNDPEKISQLLAAAGKNKSDLARAWNRDPATVTNFFDGRRQLKLDDLDKLAELLGITTVELVGKLRGQSLEPWDDEVFELAVTRSRVAVQNAKVKLDDKENASFVYLVYKHGLSEKRAEGAAHLSQATVDFLLQQKTVRAN